MSTAEAIKTADIIPLHTSINELQKKQALPEKTDFYPVHLDCSAIAEELQSAFDQVETEKARSLELERQWDARPTLNLILTGQRCKNALIAAKEEKGGATETYIKGMILALNEFSTGEQADLSSLYAIEIDGYASFVKTKIKPVLEIVGFLVKINDKSYRWANKKELLKLAKIRNKPETSRTQKVCAVTIGGFNQLVTELEERRLAKNPYIKKNIDGSVTRLRKPFTGSLTEEEKEAIRSYEERKAFEKLIGQKGLSTDAAREIQAIKDRLAIEQAQKDAEWLHALSTLKKAGLVIGGVALAGFIVHSMATAPGVPVHDELTAEITNGYQH